MGHFWRALKATRDAALWEFSLASSLALLLGPWPLVSIPREHQVDGLAQVVAQRDARPLAQLLEGALLLLVQREEEVDPCPNFAGWQRSWPQRSKP